MDEIVIRAMARWPDVPAVYGWLSLDRRGRWRLEGEPIRHEGSVRFINRNYACDERGCWFFQNGPQRVFVDLEYAPWVLALDGEGKLHAHTGEAVDRVRGAWLDDAGGLLLEWRRGPGLLDDRDLLAMSERFVEAGGSRCDEDRLERLLEEPSTVAGAGIGLVVAGARVAIEPIPAAEVPVRFGFEPRPSEPAA